MDIPVKTLAKAFALKVDRNSPVILTALAATGTVATAVLSAKAAIQAYELVEFEETKNAYEGRVTLTVKERFKLTWQCYIPAVSVGTATIACIVGANTISTKRTAAIATAYSLTEKAFGDYREKVVEQLGQTKDTKVRDAVAQDQVSKNPVSGSQVILTGNGDVLCYETMSGRYFNSNVEAIRKAQNDINADILQNMYASQNDFNELIGLPRTGYGEEVGWNLDKRLEVVFSAVLSEEGKPCIAIGYKDLPVVNFWLVA